MAKSTIYEVARLSGFSTATVSRVMRNGGGFSDETRKQVLTAAAELGWVPNHSARSLAARRAGIVGVLFPDLGVSDDIDSESALFVDQVIRGAERAATLAGDAVLIAGTRGHSGAELARSVASKVDGLVVVARSLSDKELVALSRRVPIVVLATSGTRHKLDFVGADNRGGCQAVTAHLLTKHGLRDVAFVAGPSRSPDSQERFVGYCQALSEAGLKVPESPDVHGGFTESGGARAVTELIGARRRPPQAVVFGNDEMALGGLPVLRRLKVRVPSEVAVTGFDDISAARHVRPALTTVRQPMREIGETAVRALLERIADRDAARRTTMLPTELVVRGSCGCRMPGMASA